MKNSRSFPLQNGLTHTHSSNCKKKTFRTLKLTHTGTFWLTNTVTATKAHLNEALAYILCFVPDIQ